MRVDSDSANALSKDTVMAMLYDRRGNLWVGTKRGGLNRLDSASGKAISYTKSALDPNSLPADGIMSLHEDADGKPLGRHLRRRSFAL